MDEEPEVPTEAEEIQQENQKSQENSVPFWKKIPKKVLLISIMAVGFVILLTSGWFVFKHFFQKKTEEVHKTTTEDEENLKAMAPENNFFMGIPEIVVNLRSIKAKGNILRAAFTMQLYSREDENKIKDYQPIIIDQLLSYLRDQSLADLEGAGLERMREALLTRINNVIRPLKIHRVIIKDFIIQ
jgi:flagellar FliL protein